MSKCYVCDLTKDKMVKYYNKDVCEDCLKLLYKTTPVVMDLYYPEDCFEEFA